MFQVVLKSRKTLLAHKLPLDDMQYGDVEQQLAFTLPDDMQPSTVKEIVPPSSHFERLASETEADQAGPSDKDNEVNVYYGSYISHACMKKCNK